MLVNIHNSLIEVQSSPPSVIRIRVGTWKPQFQCLVNLATRENDTLFARLLLVVIEQFVSKANISKH
jgi:hypothetical protein